MSTKTVAHVALVAENQVPREPSSSLPQWMVYETARQAAAAVLNALEAGHLVAFRRSPQGFEVLSLGTDASPETPFPVRLGDACGFSRRPVDAMMRALGRDARGFWARPAGGAWQGWAEWGTF